MAGAPCSLTSSLLQQPEGREMCGSGDGGLEARDAACVYPSTLPDLRSGIHPDLSNKSWSCSSPSYQ